MTTIYLDFFISLGIVLLVFIKSVLQVHTIKGVRHEKNKFN